MSRVGRWVVLVVVLWRALPAAAHDRTVSYSTWDIAGAGARITAYVSPLDVSRLSWAATARAELDRRLGAYLAEHLTLTAEGRPCPLAGEPTRLASTDDRVAFRWDVTCPSSRALQVRTALLLDEAPSHLHLARVRLAGRPALERVLSDAERTWTIGDTAAQTAVGDSFAAFLLLGAAHLFTGGGLVFLLGLLLLGGSARDVVRIVIGFTTGYSITLGLAVFGVVRPNDAPIEALIGLSIALVATENLWLTGGRRPLVRWAIAAALALLAADARSRGAVPVLTLAGVALFATCYFGLLARAARPAPLRAAVAFAFGLLHGFGFAETLVHGAPPNDRLARALFGFNAGIELGVVAVVLALWLPLQMAQRSRDGVVYRALVEYGSAAILAMGIFWFVRRSYG